VHLILLNARLWPALGGLENAFRFPLQHVEEFAGAERPADGFGTAQPRERLDVGRRAGRAA